MTNAPDTFENRQRRRKKERLRPYGPTDPDLKAEKAALAAELDAEAEQDQRKATGAARSRKQARADMYRSWWQANTYRKMRAMLFRFAPELETPRYLPVVEYICSQQVLYRRLLDAYEKQQGQYDSLYAALQKTLDGLPPLKEWSDETAEVLDKLHGLLKSFLNANPFQYVDKIENIAAKQIAAMREAGLTPKAARMLEINVEEELRQYKGEVAAAQEEAEEGTAHETNAQRRKRQMTQDADKGIDEGGEEEDD